MDRRAFLTALPATGLAGPAFAGAPPLVEGFAPDRLARIRPLLEHGVADKQIAGAVWQVSRHGRLVTQGVVGLADIEAKRPMTRDAIFRIFSMTKPITAVTAMTLYEEAKFDLHDPVSKWIPEFANVQVQTETPDGLGGRRLSLAPASRPIMVLDLMRHTSGLAYAGPKDANGDSIHAKLGLGRTDISLAEWVKRLAAAPLVCEPGTRANYGFGLDVLARLVEIWADRPIDVAMRERVFAPLGMSDTGYWVPPAKAGRVTVIYSPSSFGAPLPDGTRDIGGPVIPSVLTPQNAWKTDPVLKMGGAGLLSTISDYATFLEMLRNRGFANGQRVLAPLTVDLMHADVLAPIPAPLSVAWAGYGFGLSMEVDRGPGPAATLAPAGTYDWGGVGSTWMWVDPKNDITALLMSQVYPSSPRWAQLYKQIVYGALMDPA